MNRPGSVAETDWDSSAQKPDWESTAATHDRHFAAAELSRCSKAAYLKPGIALQSNPTFPWLISRSLESGFAIAILMLRFAAAGEPSGNLMRAKQNPDR